MNSPKDTDKNIVNLYKDNFSYSFNKNKNARLLFWFNRDCRLAIPFIAVPREVLEQMGVQVPDDLKD